MAIAAELIGKKARHPETALIGTENDFICAAKVDAIHQQAAH